MTYTTKEIARAAGIRPVTVRKQAALHRRGRKHGPAWIFDDADLVWFRDGRPRRGWPKGKPRGLRHAE